MRRLAQTALILFRSDDGPTSVEYAILLVLMLSVSMTATQTLGCNTALSFARISLSIQSAH
jgi:Flp pilus assembly pilin Flp